MQIKPVVHFDAEDSLALCDSCHRIFYEHLMQCRQQHYRTLTTRAGVIKWWEGCHHRKASSPANVCRAESHGIPSSGRDGALRRPRRVQRRNVWRDSLVMRDPFRLL